MQSQQFGRIVNIASEVVLGMTKRTAYAAAKAVLMSFTRTWALELAGHGITVNSISPGPVDTEFFAANNPSGSAIRQSKVDRIPRGRIGLPSDISNAVGFFMLAESEFVTGQNLYVCGGSSLGSSITRRGERRGEVPIDRSDIQRVRILQRQSGDNDMKLSYRIVGDARLRKPGGAQLGEHARPERGIEACPKDIDGACSRLISGYRGNLEACAEGKQELVKGRGDVRDRIERGRHGLPVHERTSRCHQRVCRGQADRIFVRKGVIRSRGWGDDEHDRCSGSH
jgi:hypothetical protein